MVALRNALDPKGFVWVGGNGKSGNGSRQSGIWVLDQFTRWQSMNWDYAGKLQKAQMDVAELVADDGDDFDTGLAELVHQAFLRMQPACRVHDDGVASGLLRL